MKKRRRARFVPKVVFSVTFAGVVPMCVVAAACGGNGGAGTKGDESDAEISPEGVAADAFMIPPNGVADAAFGPDIVAPDTFSLGADSSAHDGFVGAEAVAEAAFHVDAADSASDVQLTVADSGFAGDGNGSSG